MSETVLKVSGLSKAYKNLTAVDCISFCLKEGEIVGFIGANGAGKSTTIKLITGLIQPTAGKIEICGHDIKNREDALQFVGATVENPNFYGYLTAKQNLKYFATFYDGVDEQKIENLLTLVGLQDRKNDKVSKYSLGMKQRLGIAQALLGDPKLLILDEATNGLDAKGIIQIRQFLKDLCKKTGVTIFISSHILSELENLCDRFIIIDRGKIKSQFSKAQIDMQSKKSINTFLSVDDLPKAMKIITSLGLESKEKNGKIYLHIEVEKRAKLLAKLSENGIKVYSLGNVKVALEQKFLKTIKK